MSPSIWHGRSSCTLAKSSSHNSCSTCRCDPFTPVSADTTETTVRDPSLVWTSSGPWPLPSWPFANRFATSRPLYRRRPAGFTPWAFAAGRSHGPPWPTPTSDATGESSPTSPNASSPRHGRCTPAKTSAWTWTTPSTHSIRPPSTCACRCFPGPDSADTKRPSNCTRC